MQDIYVEGYGLAGFGAKGLGFKRLGFKPLLGLLVLLQNKHTV